MIGTSDNELVLGTVTVEKKKNDEDNEYILVAVAGKKNIERKMSCKL